LAQDTLRPCRKSQGECSHIAAHRETMAGTMRAEAPSFTPGVSSPGVSELEAVSFIPPPGLSINFDSADMEASLGASLLGDGPLMAKKVGGMGEGWLSSPVSTATPSPTMSAVSGMSSSPWTSPFLGPSGNSFQNSLGPSHAAFSLPEASMPPVVETDAFEFKLEGVEDLQKSVASLLAGLTLPPGLADGEGVAMDTGSTSAGTTTASQGSPPSTPPALDGCTHDTPMNSNPEDLFAEEEFAAESSCLAKPSEGEHADSQPAETIAEHGPALVVAVTPQVVFGHANTAASATADAALPLTQPQPVTTVMLKNVPRSYTREILAKRIDEAGFQGIFDFLYMPADFGKGGRACHATGHAVINFRTQEARERFEVAFHKVSGKKAFPGAGGAKVCDVSLAPAQGKDANVQKLQKSGLLMSLLAERPEWLPLLFDAEGAPETFSTDPAINS